jgi:Tol biopolymer transport system component
MRQDAVSFAQPVEWSRDGKSILSILERSDGTQQIGLVAVDDRPVRVVTDLGSTVPQYASLSPDGEWVAFDSPQGPGQAGRDVFIVRADGTERHAVVQHAANDFAPVWTPDGRRLVFASDRSGDMDLWSVAVAEGVPQGEPDVVHRGVGRMWLLGLTDQGGYYYQRVVGAVDVYVAEVSDDGRVGKPVPLGAGYAGSNLSSAWSPDGSLVAYASRRGLVSFDRGSTTLVIRELGAGGQREFIPPLSTFLVHSWSKDGRSVLVQGTDSEGRSGLFAVDCETGRTRAIPAPGSGRAMSAGWASGLGRILERGGPGLIWWDPARGTHDIALDFRAEGIEGINPGPRGPGFAASPDGRSIAFSAMLREADVLTYSLRVKAGEDPSRELFRVRNPERMLLQAWTPDGAGLLVTRRREGEPAQLWRMPVEGGAPVPIDVPIKGPGHVSMRPDGRRITFTAGSPLLEIWVIENLLSKVPQS